MATTNELTILDTSTKAPAQLIKDESGAVSPASFSFKSDLLRNFAAQVATLALDANASAHGYRKQLCRLFAANRIGDADYKQDGFKGFKDFAHRVFNLSESNAYQYMGAGTIYLNPTFTDNDVINTLPVATVYVLTGLTDDELTAALEKGFINSDTTQQEAKDYVARIKYNRGKLSQTKSPDTPSPDSDSSSPSPDSDSDTESPSPESPDSNVEVLPEYDMVLEVSTGFTKDFIGTWNDLEDVIIRQANVSSEFEWLKAIPVKNGDGKVDHKVQLFTTFDGTAYGRVRYKKAPKARKPKASKSNTVSMTMDEYNALKQQLAALQAQLQG